MTRQKPINNIFLTEPDLFGTRNRLALTAEPFTANFGLYPFWKPQPFGYSQFKLNALATRPEVSPFDVTLVQLKMISPNSKTADLTVALPYLNATMKKYEINTRLRQAHFLAQVAHESAEFRTTQEYATGAAYEGRKDLGNTVTGDGKKFKGRGLIQITGRSNYTAYGLYINQDVTTNENPKKLEKFPLASDCSGWFWTILKKLNRLADADNLTAITHKINGGSNGIKNRALHLANAKKAFNIK
jgi:putative chitinase